MLEGSRAPWHLLDKSGCCFVSWVSQSVLDHLDYAGTRAERDMQHECMHVPAAAAQRVCAMYTCLYDS
jgi:hypothetical protein